LPALLSELPLDAIDDAIGDAIDAMLQQAIVEHQAGNLTRAEELYRGILAREADHVHSLHNLGILEIQRRRPEAALPLLKVAVDRCPEHPRYWLTYLDALLRAGNAAEAQAVLAEAKQRGVAEDALAALEARLLPLTAAVEQKVWAPDLSGDNYLNVLSRLHTALAPATYLEIGVDAGKTLALARCHAIAIDPEFRFQDIAIVRSIVAKPSVALYQMPSDDFFARFNPTTLFGGPIEMAFLDGMHRCEFLLRDFFNTERHCRPNSVIALHDCVPLEAPMAERDPDAPAVDRRRQGMWTGDVWRTALLLKRRRPDLRIIVLDAAETGLVLITNLDPDNTLLADNHDQFVAEMMSWSLPEVTLAGYFAEMEVEPELNLRQPEQILARLRPTPLIHLTASRNLA
jgi:Methyltransferase domain/Tetratricopeptide repeat